MMSAGRASCAAFQIDRAWSYCSLAGVTSSPCRASASSASVASPTASARVPVRVIVVPLMSSGSVGPDARRDG